MGVGWADRGHCFLGGGRQPRLNLSHQPALLVSSVVALSNPIPAWGRGAVGGLRYTVLRVQQVYLVGVTQRCGAVHTCLELYVGM